MKLFLICFSFFAFYTVRSYSKSNEFMKTSVRGSKTHNSRGFGCPKYRTLDGTCTNSGYSRCGNKFWGSAGTAHFSYISSWTSKHPVRTDQKSARLISNVMSTQTEDMPSQCGLRELFVFFGEFLDHNLIATQISHGNEDRFNIEIPRGDSLMANFSSGVLPFRRAKRIPVLGERRGVVRAENGISSAIDLSAVYGSSVERMQELRTFRDGKMKVSGGDFMPLNIPGMDNEPSHRNKFFLAGDVRANDHPVLTSFHTIFLREHNYWCDKLQREYDYYLSDEELFQLARKINIAKMQKIVYEEFIPAITGRDLPKYRGYNPCVDPSVSDIFSTAAYRIGHTLVGNEVSRRGKKMEKLQPIPFTNMFFNPAEVFLKLGMESFVRGAFYTPAQEIDPMVSSSLRNFLFTNVRRREFSVMVDLIAINIQRGRDNALPGYNSVRRIFGSEPVRRFADITGNVNIQSKLSSLYKSPENIDPWVGLMAEDHARGSCMGPTVRAVWEREFTRIRDGDSHFYLVSRHFSKTLLKKFPEIREIVTGKKGTLKDLILRHTTIKEKELEGDIFKSK